MTPDLPAPSQAEGGEAPRISVLAGAFGPALTVDVEEWYHSCLVPELVDPARRPAGLAEELDFLLPELLGLLAEAGRRATFFVLGEVARRHPGRVREIAAAGCEIASHSDLHLRVGERSLEQFRRDAGASKARLEDLVGQPVVGFRAPEWSMRHPANPRLQVLAEEGYLYDSSLAPFLGAGRLGNPRRPCRLEWPGRGGGNPLVEVPPLTFAGPLSLPAGSWPGRLAGPAVVAGAARTLRRRGGLPVLVVHPWEISGRPTPGRLPGLAGFVHETGRRGYRQRFLRLLHALPWTTVAEACPGILLGWEAERPGAPGDGAAEDGAAEDRAGSEELTPAFAAGRPR